MPCSIRRVSGTTILCLLLVRVGSPAPAAASEEARTALPRVRTTDSRIERVFLDALDRSPTLRELVDTIEGSNVIVHVTTFRASARRPYGGELRLVGVADRMRYLRVRVRDDLPDGQFAVMLAHELQHAAEVAAHPEAVCQASLTRLYDAIGFRVRGDHHETSDAIRIADQFGRELHARRPERDGGT